MSLPNDSILFTPGSGATIATEAVSSKEYEVYMRADNRGHIIGSGDVYSVVGQHTAPTGGNPSFILANGDSTLTCDILLVTFSANDDTGDTASSVAGLTIYRGSSAGSGGTTQTPVRLDSSMTAIDADITLRSGPTSYGTTGDELPSMSSPRRLLGCTGMEIVLFAASLCGGWPIVVGPTSYLYIVPNSVAGPSGYATFVFRVR